MRPSVRDGFARAALVALVAVVSLACTRRARVGEDGGGAALLFHVLQAPAIDVIVPAGPMEERCAVVAAWAARSAHVVDDAAPVAREPRLLVMTSPEESRADHARVVVGTAADPLARILATKIGVTFPARGTFVYLTQVFDQPDDALIATFQDPDRDGLPLTLFLGNDPGRLALDLAPQLWGWKPSIRILRGGFEALAAPLMVDGACQLERVVRPAQRRNELRKGYVALPLNGASFWGIAARDVDGERTQTYFLLAAQAAARCAAWASPGRDATPCALVLHAWPEDFAAWTGSRELAFHDAHDGSVHALIARGAPDDGGAAVALGLATARLGPCCEPWLAEGAAVLACEHWYGRDLTAWAGWIERAGASLAVEALVDAASDQRHSRHVLAPLRAELVRVLLETRGTDHVRQLWRGSQRLAVDKALIDAFRMRLAACAGVSASTSPSTPANSAEALRRPRGLAGLVVSEPAHSAQGPSPAGTARAYGNDAAGYGTRACAASLARAKELGARSIAFTLTMCADVDPDGHAGGHAGPGDASSWTAREGDAALACAIGSARADGLSVALLPDLVSGPGGSWSGSWLRNGETNWRAFFGDYRRFVVHVALCAELAGADVLSLGGSLLETTRLTVEGRRGNPEELAWKSAGWASVVRAARGAFRGRLTYLAGSAQEVEKLGFWDDLDLIGLEPRVELRMRRGLQPREGLARFLPVLQGTWASADRAAREHGRPLFVAPVSFPIAPGPEDARLGPGSDGEDLRAESFERMTQLAAQSRDVLDVVAIGRWSTALSDRGLGPRDHLLSGERGAELAQRVLRELARVR